MSKYSFKNDYSEGAHPDILKSLNITNSIQQVGYGEDAYCLQATINIQKKIENSEADVHFVSGGTQANLIVISSILKPYESVIAADSGHIAVNETGAIEACGHKINTIKVSNGKLTPKEINTVLGLHSTEHMVKPKLVFISNSTELGTIYTLNELSEISKCCKINNLYLYLDGARLGSALTSKANDLSLQEIAKLVDVFYIGGTKNGALLGEAIVIINDNIKMNFRYHLKQKGALLAKERILGIQFNELFKNDLFFELARHANFMASKLSNGIKDKGFPFLVETVTNQIFPILPNDVIQKIEKEYDFHLWEEIDDNHFAIRLVTSWATTENSIDRFLLSF